MINVHLGQEFLFKLMNKLIQTLYSMTMMYPFNVSIFIYKIQDVFGKHLRQSAGELFLSLDSQIIKAHE